MALLRNVSWIVKDEIEAVNRREKGALCSSDL
jgi:hypothetical protein